jgi:hypothetical protein
VSAGIECTVYVDGKRFADGSPGDDPLAPTALAGLQIQWGRSTTVDQPEPSTCAFRVLDEQGGRAFLDELRTGLTVDVTATGTIYPDPTVGTFLDPEFLNPDTPAIVTNATGTPVAGVYELHPKDAARTMTAVFAPAPFELAGTNPAAWDAIPATSAGQTWSIAARIKTAPGAHAVIRPVLFTGPWKNTAVIVDDPVEVTIDDAWTDVTATFVPELDGAWVGLQVTVYPTGPRWIDVDPALTWAEVDPARTWLDMDTTRLESVNAFTPAAGVERTVLVFSGRITDMNAAWDEDAGAVVVDVTCQDFTADLDNTRVGDQPWAVEPMSARFNRVLELTGLPITAEIDPTLAATLVSYQDVDSQPATALLQDLAQSVDGVLWSATHQVTGPYLHVEDPNQRTPLGHLELVNGVVVIVYSSTPGDRALRISACDILRDPVEWLQSVADVTTRASVGWLEQGVDDKGKPTTTDRTQTMIDPGLEAQYGQRGISVGTLLQSATDAADVATRLLARTSQYGWRASGLHIDDDTIEQRDAIAVIMLLELLDGTIRNGRSLRLTDLPPWSPVGADVGVYLEGGTYTYDSNVDEDATIWQLDLTVSNGAGAGTSLRWIDADPTWTWSQVDPNINWLDLYGVGPTPTTALEEALA